MPIAVLGIATLLSASSSSAQTNTPTRSQEITSARAILDLAGTNAAFGTACRIRGVVTCSARKGDLFFVQDASAGIYVYLFDALPPQGSWVEVRGTASKGLFSPIIMGEKVTVLGQTNLPPPLPVAIEELAYGRYDAQWIEIQGIVTRQSLDWGHLLLQIASGSARIEARVLEFDPAQTPNLVDARIKLRGVAGTAYNDRRQLTGFHIVTQNTNAIEVVRPPPPDPFSAPLRTSANLMAYFPGGGSEHRARLRGVVTIAWPGHGFYIHDGVGNVRISPEHEGTPALGDVVEVVGFAAPTLNRPVIRDAVFRVVGKSHLPEPRPIRARDAVSGNAEGERVVLDAYVLKTAENHGDHLALVLEADQKVFRARYLDSWRVPSGPNAIGSKIRASGICTRDSASGTGSEDFSIWLPSENDVLVLERSPAWRQRVTLVIVGSLATSVALGGAWVFLLRRRVRTQTNAIRQREANLEERYLDLFQNANDIIYTHDLEGRITSVNNSGQELLGRTAQELLGTKIDSLIDPEDLPSVQKQIADKLAGKPRTSYEVRIRRSDGQRLVLEVNSRLLYQDGQPIGIQGIARDITERTEAEEALRSSERQLRASLEDRERLGRDLHDDIIQSIYAAGLTLDDCTRIIKPDPETATKRLRTVTSELNRVIRDVRNFIERLEREPLSGAEFKTSLQSLALNVGGRTPPQIEVRIDDFAAASLLPHQATHLLHIAREALSNSLRHGSAQHVTFTLQPSRGGIRFEIADDGSGFRPATPERRGHGLRNMNARADRLGAWLTIHSHPGQGTRIVLEIPHESHDDAPHAHSRNNG